MKKIQRVRFKKVIAEDTTVEGLIWGRDESKYWREVKQLERWCREKNLVVYINKTKELIIDFRRL